MAGNLLRQCPECPARLRLAAGAAPGQPCGVCHQARSQEHAGAIRSAASTRPASILDTASSTPQHLLDSQLTHCLLAQQVSQLELDVVWCTSSSDCKVIYTGDISKVAAMLASLVGVCTEHLETVNIRLNCYTPPPLTWSGSWCATAAFAASPQTELPSCRPT